MLNNGTLNKAISLFPLSVISATELCQCIGLNANRKHNSLFHVSLNHMEESYSTDGVRSLSISSLV